LEKNKISTNNFSNWNFKNDRKDFKKKTEIIEKEDEYKPTFNPFKDSKF
jgi:hypothetical protein